MIVLKKEIREKLTMRERVDLFNAIEDYAEEQEIDMEWMDGWTVYPTFLDSSKKSIRNAEIIIASFVAGYLTHMGFDKNGNKK